MRRRSRCAGAFREPSGAFRVIGKVIRGTNARRLLYYLYGPGKANEHTDPHLVAGFGDPAELEPERRPDGSRDFRRLAGLLAQPLAALNGDNYAQPVWHCAVRAAPEDRLLSDAEWAQVAAQIMDRTGLAPDGDDLGGAVGGGPARRGSHPPGGHAGPPGPAPAGAVERLLPSCGTPAGTPNGSSGCGLPPRRIAPRRGGPPAPRRNRRPAAGGRRRPGCRLRREVCTAAAGARTEAGVLRPARPGRGAGAPAAQHRAPG